MPAGSLFSAKNPEPWEVTTEGGISARARLNLKSYRKAMDAVGEQGLDNVAVILQGRMVTPGDIMMPAFRPCRSKRRDDGVQLGRLTPRTGGSRWVSCRIASMDGAQKGRLQ
jgi:hypothetical protein